MGHSGPLRLDGSNQRTYGAPVLVACGRDSGLETSQATVSDYRRRRLLGRDHHRPPIEAVFESIRHRHPSLAGLRTPDRRRRDCRINHQASPSARDSLAAGHQGEKQKRVRSPYLRTIAVIVVCAAVVASIVDYQFKIISSSSLRTEADLVGFFGQFYATTGLSTLLLQFVIASRLFQSFGAVVVMAILPFMLGFGSMSVLFWPVLSSAVLSRFSDQTFRYTLHNGALELLSASGLAGSAPQCQAVHQRQLEKHHRRHLGRRHIRAPVRADSSSAQPCFFSILRRVGYLARKLRSLYVSELQSAIAKRQLPLEDLEVSVTDALTVRVIDRTLLEGDAPQQLFVLDLIANLVLTPWRETLRKLLAHGTSEVNARILQIASNDRDDRHAGSSEGACRKERKRSDRGDPDNRNRRIG